MKNTQIEVEGGELLLQSKEGHYAIIPSKHRQRVMTMIDNGNDDEINEYIQSLPKDSDYAEDGSLIPATIKAQDGLVIGDGDPPTKNEATRQDSLDVMKNALLVDKYYRDKKYELLKSDPVENDFINHLNKKNEWFTTVGGTVLTDSGRVPRSKVVYRETIDKNKFKQREAAASILDLHSPMPLYDKRIKPQYTKTYYNIDDQDILENNRVNLMQYHPLAVAPWDLLTPEAQKLRLKHFGTSGTPYADKKSSTEPVKQEPVLKPISKGIKPISKDVTKKQETPKQDIPVQESVKQETIKQDIPKQDTEPYLKKMKSYGGHADSYVLVKGDTRTVIGTSQAQEYIKKGMIIKD